MESYSVPVPISRYVPYSWNYSKTTHTRKLIKAIASHTSLLAIRPFFKLLRIKVKLAARKRFWPVICPKALHALSSCSQNQWENQVSLTNWPVVPPYSHQGYCQSMSHLHQSAWWHKLLPNWDQVHVCIPGMTTVTNYCNWGGKKLLTSSSMKYCSVHMNEPRKIRYQSFS